MTHSHFQQTTGHELTHIVLEHILHPATKVPLVDEGIAVYLDQTGRGRLQLLKKILRYDGINFTPFVLSNWSSREQGRWTYPFYGAFIEYLLEQDGKERLFRLLKDQRLEHAYEVYGQEHFSWLIDDFQRKLKE